MKNWFKRLFCRHDWEAVKDDFLAPGIPDFICKKCGKKEGLL